MLIQGTKCALASRGLKPNVHGKPIAACVAADRALGGVATGTPSGAQPPQVQRPLRATLRRTDDTGGDVTRTGRASVWHNVERV
jgi:hypothetical protein